MQERESKEPISKVWWPTDTDTSC